MRLLLSALLLLVSAAGNEQSLPAPAITPRAFPPPACEDFELANGMKVTLISYGSVPKVTVRAFVEAGGVDEGADQVWLSKLVTLLVEQGTRTRSAEQVVREAAAMGGKVELNAGPEFTSVGGVVLSEFGPQFVRLVADVLRNPLLLSSDMERVKGDVGRQLAGRTANLMSQARMRLDQVLFQDLFPNESALTTYTQGQVQQFYGDNFSARRTHLYVAGRLDPRLRPTIERAFAGWQRGSPREVSSAKPPTGRSFHIIDWPDAPRAIVLLGIRVAQPGNPDYVPLLVLNTLLDSRINSKIVPGRGYYSWRPFSQIETRRHLAFWLYRVGVIAARTGTEMKEILFEINRLRNEAPPFTEVRDAQRRNAGDFFVRYAVSGEPVSADNVIHRLHFVDSQGLPRSFMSEYVMRVMAVTPTEIRRAAESYLSPDDMTTVVVGDKTKIADQLKAYEPAKEVR